MQRIERVEELLLRTVLAREELNVVDQQHVHGPVLVTELAHPGGRDRADHLVCELFGSEIHDALAREAVVNLMADGVHEVSLAQPHTSIKKEWVVAVARSFGDCLGSGMSELRVVPDDERREPEAGVEL